MSKAPTPTLKDLARAFFSELGRRLADPVVMSFVVAVGFVLAGFVAIGLAWHEAAATLFVPVQMPYAVSGALGGLALVIIGAGVLHGQGSRWLEARERAEMDNFVKESRRLLAAVHALRAKGYDRRKITSLVRAKARKLAPTSSNSGSTQTPG